MPIPFVRMGELIYFLDGATDDKELIKLCKIENAPFICAMGAVVRLYSKNKVTKEKAQDVLKRLYGYGRYSEDIYDFFKAKVM